MITFLETATASNAPFPDIEVDFTRPRGVITFGGPPLAGRIPRLTVRFVDGHDSAPGLADFMRSVGYCFVSAKLRSVLEYSHAEIEFLPIVALYGDKPVPDAYFLANPLRCIRGVDLEESKIELDEQGIALSVQSLVLNESLFEGVPVSVLHETRGLAVHPAVRSAISRAGCTGCSFVSPTEVQF